MTDWTFTSKRLTSADYLPSAARALGVGLLSFAGAGWLVTLLSAPPASVVFAVALGFSSVWVARTQTTAERGAGAFALMCAAAAAAATSLLPAWPGQLTIAAVLGATIWCRRYGRRATVLGTTATLPFIAELVVASPHPTAADIGWRAAIAGIVVAAITLFEVVAPLPPPADAAPPRETSLRPRPSTRMAAQMTVSVAAAFGVSHFWFTTHPVWLPLTAYIVAAGNRGRRDIRRKGVLRLVGAAGGTLLAALIPGTHTAWLVVGIFVTLTAAFALRAHSYVWWAAGSTCALSLLYSYQGINGPFLDRLGAITLAATIATAVGELLLPVPPRRRLRRP